MSRMYTWAPSWANRRAQAWPIPWEPPVITTTWPLKRWVRVSGVLSTFRLGRLGRGKGLLDMASMVKVESDLMLACDAAELEGLST